MDDGTIDFDFLRDMLDSSVLTLAQISAREEEKTADRLKAIELLLKISVAFKLNSEPKYTVNVIDDIV